MSEKATVFISHATEKDTSDRKCLKDLKKKLKRFLKDKPLQPFIDFEDIGVAENWRIRIDKGLGNAVVGIIFLNERAKIRPWVFKEAVIMCWMQKIWPQFKLIIIGYGENIVSSWLNSEQWHIENLADYQQIDDALTNRDTSFPKDCFEKIKPALNAAIDLSVNHKMYQFKDQLRQYMMPQMHRLPPEKFEKALHELITIGAENLSSLFRENRLGRKNAIEILFLLAPQWLEPEIAEVLSRSVGDKKLSFVLVSKWPDFALSCLFAQFTFSTYGMGVKQIKAPSIRSEEDYLTVIEQELQDKLMGGIDGYGGDNAINEFLEDSLNPDIAEPPLPVFLLIYPELEISASTITAILNKWPLLRVMRIISKEEFPQFNTDDALVLNKKGLDNYLETEQKQTRLFINIKDKIENTGIQAVGS